MTSECLFMKYTREIVDNSFGEYPKYKAYGALLKKCTCDRCMKEKASLKRFETSLKNPYYLAKLKREEKNGQRRL